MKKEELFGMSIGSYVLTDEIENYYYTLVIGVTADNERTYIIKEKGAEFGSSIYLSERYIEEGKTKVLSSMSGVGGLYIHSLDNERLLAELRLVEG